MERGKSLRLTKVERERLVALCRYMEEHLEEQMTVEWLANRAGMHPKKLNAAFRKLFGKEPRIFLLEARMKKAYHLLTHTDKPIKEIAAICGYNNRSSFFRVFRKYYQQTPDGLRRGM